MALGLPDFDVSAARGPSRELTRQVARWAQEHGFQGIAYRSRFADDLNCWAIFEGAAISPTGPFEAIAPADVDLLSAAQLFGLTIER